jgi:HPr kinase/phosphorylase
VSAGAAAAPAPVAIHASAVALGEAGILIRGASGAGKSSLALALLEAARQTGRFGALIGDDVVHLFAIHGRLIARGHPAVRGKIERRGQGIMEIGAEPAAVVRLVVDLVPPDQAARYPDPVNPYVTLCAVELPLLRLRAGSAAADSALTAVAWLRQFGTI